MAAYGSINLSRKQLIASSLCKHFSLDPKAFSSDLVGSDVKTVYLNILQSSGKDSCLTHKDEVIKWIDFAESFPTDSKGCFDVLNKLNEDLVTLSVLLGNGLRPSEADVIVFSAINPFVMGLPNANWEKWPHVIRWMDYIQMNAVSEVVILDKRVQLWKLESKQDLGELFGKILLKKPCFEPPLAKTPARMETDSLVKKTAESTKSASKSEVDSNKKTNDDAKKAVETQAAEKDKKKKATGDKDATQEKKKSSETDSAEKDTELSVCLLNIQVGLIRKAWKHPSADSLLVEEIDVGEGKLRQVVSGLAKYCNPDDLTNRRVVLITNVKPGKLRDVMSEGLVLCASNEDHSVVEPLLPPEGAKPGERVSFSGIDGKPEDVLNPKKKQLEKITPNLFTDDKGVATFKGIPFMTSAGPCTASISRANIK